MSLNVERFQQLSEHLRKHGDDFTMKMVFHGCGSPACIAGTAIALFIHMNRSEFLAQADEYDELFASIMGISCQDASVLCATETYSSIRGYDMEWWPNMQKSRDDWTAKDAADVLDAYVLWKLTGQVRPERVE